MVGPDDQSAFSHLLNKPMSSRQLISALSHVGANFFPEPDGGKFVSITKKRGAGEMECYNSMALASCGFGFQWSRFNADTSPAKVVVQVAEHKLGGGEVCLLKSSSSSAFSKEMISLYECLQSIYLQNC